MSLKLSETGKRIRKFKWLADDLAIANTSFYFFKKLSDAQKREFRGELRKSQEFWGYTQRAHCIVSLIYLCRVFDTYRNKTRKAGDAFHLLRLIEEIDKSKLSNSEKRQLQADLNFLQKEDLKNNKFPNSKVAKLRKWRNNLLSHSNEDLILKGLNDFLVLNPLTRSEIQQLIDKGFSILERWAAYYKASLPIKRLAQERADYLIVLQLLRAGPRQRK
jgi:hypothetical protein